MDKETALDMLNWRIREALRDRAVPRQPDTIISLEMTRAEWTAIKNELHEARLLVAGKQAA